MYHIKDDLRAVKSAGMLYDGLVSCLREKEFASISITDISGKSTVSRATFYRNFDAIIDLLYWKCSCQFAEVLHDYVQSGPAVEKADSLLLHVLNYWMEHVEVLEILMNIPRIDIIYNSFIENAAILMDYYAQQGIPVQEVQYNYFLSIRAGYLIGIIRAWIVSGKKQTAEEVAAIVKRQHQIVLDSGMIF